MSNETDIADGTLVVICWYEDGQLTTLVDDGSENGEPDLYVYGREAREAVKALADVTGTAVRAVTVSEFRKMAGEAALNDFDKLARHRGRPDYRPLLELAETLLDGGIPDEIELDLEETPWDELDAWAENGCTEYGALLGLDPGTWVEDTRGGAEWVTFDDDAETDDD
ncbi:MAG TPA: hypothetical protein VG253_00520 [Streptosporangiaceae bacterium]|nr:hypothetical protein [Streptosporangiaceae bacterium]